MTSKRTEAGKMLEEIRIENHAHYNESARETAIEAREEPISDASSEWSLLEENSDDSSTSNSFDLLEAEASSENVNSSNYHQLLEAPLLEDPDACSSDENPEQISCANDKIKEFPRAYELRAVETGIVTTEQKGTNSVPIVTSDNDEKAQFQALESAAETDLNSDNTKETDKHAEKICIAATRKHRNRRGSDQNEIDVCSIDDDNGSEYVDEDNSDEDDDDHYYDYYDWDLDDSGDRGVGKAEKSEKKFQTAEGGEGGAEGLCLSNVLPSSESIASSSRPNASSPKARHGETDDDELRAIRISGVRRKVRTKKTSQSIPPKSACRAKQPVWKDCPICLCVFEDMHRFDQHLRAHAQKAPNVCPKCYNIPRSENEMVEHLRRHSEEVHFYCLTCQLKFGGQSQLTIHRLQCQWIAESQQQAAEIFDGFHDSTTTVHQCDICPETLDSSLEYVQHRRPHEGRPTLRCPECTDHLYSAKKFLRHRQARLDSAKFQCNNCDSRFRSQVHLKFHNEANAAVEKFVEHLLKRFAKKQFLFY